MYKRRRATKLLPMHPIPAQAERNPATAWPMPALHRWACLKETLPRTSSPKSQLLQLVNPAHVQSQAAHT